MPSRHQVDLSTRFTAGAPQPPTRQVEQAGGDLGRWDGPLPTVTVEREPYIAGPELQDAVNLAIALGRPLLLQGDPGVGKSRLAHAVAYALGLPLEEAYVKSTSHAQDLLYTYDAVARLYDAQLPGDRKVAVDYIRLGPLGRAIARAQHGRRSVVLIDEIDKADIDFPNDLLHELDQLRFAIPEAGGGAGFAVPGDRPDLRPIVIVTNNEEKALPAAFLRRCVFHYIEFPTQAEQLSEILAAHEVGDPVLREEAIAILRQLRGMDLAKKPGLSELLDWVSYRQAVGGKPADENGDIPHLGALLKRRDDQRRAREQRGSSTERIGS
ncbi:MAG TPA: MoxR family ATPase [Trebonia sp.]|nr:MoxR family ATPase [Trebonia sp.]